MSVRVEPQQVLEFYRACTIQQNVFGCFFSTPETMNYGYNVLCKEAVVMYAVEQPSVMLYKECVSASLCIWLYVYMVLAIIFPVAILI